MVKFLSTAAVCNVAYHKFVQIPHLASLRENSVDVSRLPLASLYSYLQVTLSHRMWKRCKMSLMLPMLPAWCPLTPWPLAETGECDGSQSLWSCQVRTFKYLVSSILNMSSVKYSKYLVTADYFSDWPGTSPSLCTSPDGAWAPGRCCSPLPWC